MVLTGRELRFARAVGQLNYTNPFSPARLELEKEALDEDFIPEPDQFWSLTPEQTLQRRSNLILILARTRELADSLQLRLQRGGATDEQLRLYEELVNYVLFYEMLEFWGAPIRDGATPDVIDRRAWERFSKEFDRRMSLNGLGLPSKDQKVSLFELFHQIYRAFFSIFECVIGRSRPAARLRERIWQSIFTHDLRRYRRSLYRSMAGITTLISGPSGSGKELVARAIGLSGRIPFLVREQRFEVQPPDVFFAINVSAFATNLVESDLFGHAKGAFTDAANARVGWLEACGDYGAVLLDEIGELTATTQVKLLRVLQNRQFQRLGETRIREFRGKIIAATNRDLRREIEQGTFREDLYYRLCADVIETPSLAAQTADNPAMLQDLVAQIVQRMVPEEQTEITAEVLQWIQENLPEGYCWPGNIRELEQCVRNVMICGRYNPASTGRAEMLHECSGLSPEILDTARRMQDISLTADELLQRYCHFVYHRTRSFEKAAKLLQLDRRTVRARTDQAKVSGIPDHPDRGGPPDP
jgi:DNA-binding NtrC family response regulator